MFWAWFIEFALNYGIYTGKFTCATIFSIIYWKFISVNVINKRSCSVFYCLKYIRLFLPENDIFLINISNILQRMLCLLLCLLLVFRDYSMSRAGSFFWKYVHGKSALLFAVLSLLLATRFIIRVSSTFIYAPIDKIFIISVNISGIGVEGKNQRSHNCSGPLSRVIIILSSLIDRKRILLAMLVQIITFPRFNNISVSMRSWFYLHIFLINFYSSVKFMLIHKGIWYLLDF